MLLKNLYWYDKPIKSFLGLKGILQFIWFRFNYKEDEVLTNYNIKPLYFARPIGDGLKSSGATTWNCTSLNNDPIIEGNSTCKLLESNAKKIIDEYKSNIDSIAIHPDNTTLAKNGEWSGIFLYGVGGKRNAAVEGKFTQTFKVIEQLPISKNFGFVLISRLAPGTKVLPHCGSSNLRFRYHLALDVPEPDKVSIRVGKHWQGWQEGKAFGFDDSFEHEVIHNGSKPRVVLIVDTWNPALSKEEIKLLDHPVFHSFGRL